MSRSPLETSKEKGCTQSDKIRTALLPNSAINNSSSNNSPNSALLLQTQRIGLLTLGQALEAKCFPPTLTTGLYYLKDHCPTVRKDAEMATYGIPYLPSFLQRANPLLRLYCRQEICSRSLGDGTRRVEYYFRSYAEGVGND